MPVYVLIGEEEALATAWLEENLLKWIDSPAWRPYNFHSLDARKVAFQDFENLIQSFPMGSSYRVVVVKDLDKADIARKKRFPAISTAFPETTILIYWFLPCSSDMKKLSLGKEWEEILKSAKMLKFGLKKDEKLKWLRTRLKEKGLVLTREGEVFLLESTGGDLSRLEHELEKISAYGSVTTSDIETLVSQADSSLFTLLDGIGERKAGKALHALKSLLDQGEPPLRILAAVASQVRLLWQISAFLEARKSPQEISKTMKVHPYRVTRGLEQLKNFKPLELPKFLDWLVRADWSLKTGRQEPRHVLELILARVCGSGTASPIRGQILK